VALAGYTSPMNGARYLNRHEDRMAWIMGSSRSGSTWLLRMLCELPELVGVDDPHLGHHLGIWRPLPLAWATARERPELTTLNELKRDKDDYFFSDRYRDAWVPALRDLVRARFGAKLDAAGSVREPRLVVKEPGAHAAPEIFELFPDARLIFLLRDGRDVVDSWVDAYGDGSWAIEGGAFEVAPEKRLPLIEWLASVWAYRTRVVSRAFAERAPDRRVLVRYEHLLERPRLELARVCATLGVDAADAELERIVDRHAFSNVDRSQRGSGQEVRAANPGSWRVNLTSEEQAAMTAIMGPELRAMGYEPGARVAA
jgi:Sulfotransferase family